MISSGTFFFIALGIIVAALLIIPFMTEMDNYRAKREHKREQEWHNEFLRELRHVLGVTKPLRHSFSVEAGHRMELEIVHTDYSYPHPKAYRLVLRGCVVSKEDSKYGSLYKTVLEEVSAEKGDAVKAAHTLIDVLKDYQEHAEAAGKRLEADAQLSYASITLPASFRHSDEELEEYHS